MHMSVSNVLKVVKSNSPEIFTVLGAVGVVATAYLSVKGAFKAAEIIDNVERSGPLDDPKERFREQAEMTWKCYIPAAIAGAATIGCITASQKASNRRTVAAVAAYSVLDQVFSDYKEKVIEQIGSGKEQKIRDEVAQSRVTKNPPTQVLVMGSGHVLCCENFTGRYFRSDMETLRKAQNDINSQILKDVYVSLNEFYDLVGLPPTSNSDVTGWNYERNMDLSFSTVLGPSNEPCLVFDYNYTKVL
jgi:Family of unknown function (DUF6353)